LINAVALDTTSKALYVADVTRIRRVDLATSQVKSVAGSWASGHKDGKGAAARFWVIAGLSLAGGHLYAVEASLDEKKQSGSTAGWRGWGNVRRVDLSDWSVVTVAGTHGAVASGQTPEVDGFGPFARFMDPRAAATVKASSGKQVLLVAGHASIRGMSLETLHVSTAAGTLIQDFSHYDVRAVAAVGGRLYAPTWSGDLLELPLEENRPIRKVGLCQGSAAGMPHFIDAVAIAGRQLFIADSGLQGICRVDLDGKLGKSCCSGCQETCAMVFQHLDYQEWHVNGMAHDGRYLYLTAAMKAALIRIDPVSHTHQQLALAHPLKSPWGVVAARGLLYVANTEANQVVLIDPTSGATRYIGDGLARTRDGFGEKASLCRPLGLTTDGVYLFVGESHCPPEGGVFHGHAVRQVHLGSGEVTTLVGPGPRPYVVEGTGTRGSINRPGDLAYDAVTGALYVADAWDNVVLKID